MQRWLSEQYPLGHSPAKNEIFSVTKGRIAHASTFTIVDVPIQTESHIFLIQLKALFSFTLQIWQLLLFIDTLSPLLATDFTNPHIWTNDILFLNYLIYCSSLSYIFGHAPMVNVCWCDVFSHVQIFWSYSFGHLESVK